MRNIVYNMYFKITLQMEKQGHDIGSVLYGNILQNRKYDPQTKFLCEISTHILFKTYYNDIEGITFPNSFEQQ